MAEDKQFNKNNHNNTPGGSSSADSLRKLSSQLSPNDNDEKKEIHYMDNCYRFCSVRSYDDV